MNPTGTLTIRPERPSDYAVIADLHAAAFNNRASEPLILSMHRHRHSFDADLSLVAESGGLVVGHALFSPQIIRLLDQNARAVALGPIAVLPAHQKAGVGRALIQEGHRVALDKGYELSYLLGHRNYYPRFGYRPGAFGTAAVLVETADLDGETLAEGSVDGSTVPALQELWRRAEGNVDFSIEPGPSILDWLSPDPSIRSTVYWRDGAVVGYTRVHEGTSSIRMFLACDESAARAMAAVLGRLAGNGRTEISLPLHPASVGATLGRQSVSAWEAAMAVSLSGARLDTYLEEVAAGMRPAGRAIWPVAFDL